MGSPKTLEIDIIKLYSGVYPGFQTDPVKTAHDRWNEWLTKMNNSGDMNGLNNVRVGLQMGMATADKNGMVTPELATQYFRWIGSIEKTMRKILKAYRHLANDKINNPHSTAKSLNFKRMSDAEFEAWLRSTSY